MTPDFGHSVNQMTRTRGEVPGLACGQRAKVPKVEQHWWVKRAPGQARPQRPQRQAAGFWAAGPVPSERSLPSLRFPLSSTTVRPLGLEFRGKI